jgi:hypothetical protein
MSDATTTQNQARGRGNGIEIFMCRKVHAPDETRGCFVRGMNRLDGGLVFHGIRDAVVQGKTVVTTEFDVQVGLRPPKRMPMVRESFRRKQGPSAHDLAAPQI